MRTSMFSAAAYSRIAEEAELPYSKGCASVAAAL